MIKEKDIEELVKEVLDENGFIVSVKVSTSNKIVILVDGYNGFSIDECVRISRHIESNLDREKEDFELEVSTPGLDSPFTVKEQFIKNKGNEVVLMTDNKPFKAILKEVTEDTIRVEFELEVKPEGKKKKEKIKKEEEYKFIDIKWVKSVIKFKKN